MKKLLNILTILVIVLGSFVLPSTHSYAQAPPTVTIQIIASIDDVQRDWGITPNYAEVSNNNPAGGGNLAYGSGMKFKNILVPQGANITNAYITFRASGSNNGTNVVTRLHAYAADNATVSFPSGGNTAGNRNSFDAIYNVQTTNITLWGTLYNGIGNWTIEQTINSPNIAAVIQEVIDRPAWSSNNSMIIFWDDFGAQSTSGDTRVRYSYAYDLSPTKAPILTIQYAMPPTLSTSAASFVTANKDGQTYAQLNGSLGLNSDSSNTWFDYGLTSGYGSSTTNTTQTSNGTISQGVTGLTAGQTYHFRFGGTSNNSGSTLGSDANFTISMPTGVTNIAGAKTTTTANVSGNVTSMGSSNSTYMFFEYGTTIAYGSNTTAQNTTSTGIFTANITGLIPNTTYHYRTVVQIGSVYSYGNDQTFVTVALPTVAQQANNLLNTVLPILLAAIVIIITAILFNSTQDLAVLIMGLCSALVVYVVTILLLGALF